MKKTNKKQSKQDVKVFTKEHNPENDEDFRLKKIVERNNLQSKILEKLSKELNSK